MLAELDDGIILRITHYLPVWDIWSLAGSCRIMFNRIRDKSWWVTLPNQDLSFRELLCLYQRRYNEWYRRSPETKWYGTGWAHHGQFGATLTRQLMARIQKLVPDEKLDNFPANKLPLLYDCLGYKLYIDRFYPLTYILDNDHQCYDDRNQLYQFIDKIKPTTESLSDSCIGVKADKCQLMLKLIINYDMAEVRLCCRREVIDQITHHYGNVHGPWGISGLNFSNLISDDGEVIMANCPKCYKRISAKIDPAKGEKRTVNLSPANLSVFLSPRSTGKYRENVSPGIEDLRFGLGKCGFVFNHAGQLIVGPSNEDKWQPLFDLYNGRTSLRQAAKLSDDSFLLLLDGSVYRWVGRTQLTRLSGHHFVEKFVPGYFDNVYLLTRDGYVYDTGGRDTLAIYYENDHYCAKSKREQLCRLNLDQFLIIDIVRRECFDGTARIDLVYLTAFGRYGSYVRDLGYDTSFEVRTGDNTSFLYLNSPPVPYPIYEIRCFNGKRSNQLAVRC